MKMFRKFFVLLLCIACGSVLSAQAPDGIFEQWGHVTVDELRMTACPFERGAEAMLIYDMSEVYYNKMSEAAFKHAEFLITNSYYQRYKIFTEKGTRKANRSVRLNLDHDDTIRNIRATCYELVGGEIKKTELDPKDVHTTKVGPHINEVAFTVPAVKAGCVFEVAYDKVGEVSYTLPDWYFTSDVPVDTSRLNVGFLKCINYYEDRHDAGNIVATVTDPFNSEIDVPARYIDMYGRRHLKGTASIYTAAHIPSYHNEPYMNSRENYITWIGFQLKGYSQPFDDDDSYIKSFGSLSDHLYENEMFNLNISKNPIPKDKMKSLVHDGMSDDQKAKAIYEYIRDNMEATGAAIIPTTPNATLWTNKTGSWADISVLLICVLRSQGIKAYPVLVGSRSNAYMNKDYPILADFEGMNVMVQFADGRKVILDPTDRNLAYGEPDMDQLNTQALVFHGPDERYWYDISDNVTSAEEMTIDASLDDSGKVTGTARLYLTNHSASAMIEAYRDDDKEELTAYLTRRIPAATIESVSDSIEGSSFVFRIAFSAQAVTDNDGNIYLPVTAVYGEISNPFISRERIADVDMIYRREGDVRMAVHIPAGYTVDALPAPESVSMADTGAIYSAGAEAQGGILILHQHMEYRRSLYRVADYPAFYDFQKKYYDLRQRPVMLRKKS